MAKAAATSETATSWPGDGSAAKLSISVQPFANMRGDAEQDYFADGTLKTSRKRPDQTQVAHR